MKPISDVFTQIPGSAKVGLAFSAGKDSMACLHLLRDRLDLAIFVDPGFLLPETVELVNYASSLVPMHVVKTDRKAQNEREGIPADIVPIDWTSWGQRLTGPKPIVIQGYRQCHWENINNPLWEKAKELKLTHLVNGARADEFKNASAQAVIETEGITELCPLHDWTAQDVLGYLETQMEVPEHYYLVHDSSSLDCYDCPAFESSSQNRVAWMKGKYPQAYAAYAVRRNAVYQAIQEALQSVGPAQPLYPPVRSKREDQ